eukprot:m.592098 g.592098  ORF g.592098 m.592098 type:complete len:810 (-) comp22389_c0_seq18:2280-4709(-)
MLATTGGAVAIVAVVLYQQDILASFLLIIITAVFFLGGVCCSSKGRILLWPFSKNLFGKLMAYRYIDVNTTVLSLESFPSSVARQKLKDIVVRAVDEYVISWYQEWSKDAEPPQAINQCMNEVVDAIVHKIYHIDKYDFGAKMLAILCMHFDAFNTSRIATGGTGIKGIGSYEKLMVHYEKSHAAHPAVLKRARLKNYFCEVATIMMQECLPAKEAASETFVHLMSRMLAVKGFETTLETISDPDYLYQSIVSVLEVVEETGSEEKAECDTRSSRVQNDPADVVSTRRDQEARPMAETTSVGTSSAQDIAVDTDGVDSDDDATKLCEQPDAEQDTAPTQSQSSGPLVMSDTPTDQGRIVSSPHPEHSEHPSPVSESDDDELNPCAEEDSFTNINLQDVPAEGLPMYTANVLRFKKMAHHAEYVLLIRSVQHRRSDAVSPTDASDYLTNPEWQITRRYREFRRLHLLLCTKFSTKMRKIVLPPKITTFTLNGMDSSKLEGRRVRLDNYLQSLTDCPQIASSYELCQFLSYESLLFPNVRTSDGRSVVSRVKRLGDKVSEFAESTLVHRFRRTGRAPKTMMFVRRGRHARTTASDQDNPFYKYLHTPAAEGDNTTSDIREVKVAADNPGVQHTVMAHVAGPQPSPSANLHVLFPRLLLGLAAESTGFGKQLKERHTLRSLLENVGGGFLDSFARAELDYLFGEEYWLFYIDSIANAMFGPEAPERTEEMKAATKSKAYQLMKESLPVAIRKPFAGYTRTDEALLNILASFQSHRLNKHFFLRMFDVCISCLLPEITSLDPSNVTVQAEAQH